MDLVDIKNESLCIGLFYNDVKLFDKYGDKINPALDFGLEDTRYFYRLLYDCYISQGKISETAVKVFVDSSDIETKNKFKELGGLDTLERMRDVAVESVSDIEPVYTRLKTFYAMREMQERGIDMEKYFDVFKDESPEFLIENYERFLNRVSLNLQGINSPENIANGMMDFIIELQQHPDVGIDLPHELMNRYLRGLRMKTVNCIAAHTNKGKTRIVSDILIHTSVFNNHKCLFISTEMTEKEMKLQFLTSVYNHLFVDDDLQETTIATNNVTDEQRENLKKAAEFFEAHCDIDFVCVNIYDFETLKRYIKQAEMNGAEMVVIDVLKPMRSGNGQVLQEWQQYPRTVEQLKDLMIELDMTLLFTAQLTTQSVNEKDLDINNIANGTQISHVLDSLLIFRDIQYKELETSSYIPTGNKEEDAMPFDLKKRYMLCKIVKNRSGMAGAELVLEANRGAVTFNELGRFVRNQAVV